MNGLEVKLPAYWSKNQLGRKVVPGGKEIMAPKGPAARRWKERTKEKKR